MEIDENFAQKVTVGPKPKGGAKAMTVMGTRKKLRISSEPQKA